MLVRESDAGEESHIDPGELLRRPRGLLPLGNPRMVKWIRKCQRATEVGGEWVKFHLRGGFTPLNPHRVSASGLVKVDQRPLAAVPPARLAPRLLLSPSNSCFLAFMRPRLFLPASLSVALCL